MTIVRKAGSLAVIGSGISGLSFAYYLSYFRPDIKITIFEKSSRTGGYISSPLDNKSHKVILEKGPRTLRTASDGTLMIADLFQRCGRCDEVYGVAKTSLGNKKYILDWQNHLVEAPSSFYTAWNFLFGGNLLTKGLINDILKEPWRPGPIITQDESVEGFFSRRFGPRVTDNVVSAIYNGIYAGDVGDLSIRSVMPRLFDVKKSHRSVVLAHITSRLANGLFTGVKGLFRAGLTMLGLLKKKWGGGSDLLRHYQCEFSTGNVWFLKNILKKMPIISLKNGMESVTNLLRDQLQGISNVKYVYDCDISGIKNGEKGITISYTHNGTEHRDIFDHINCTVSPKGLSDMVEDPKLSNLLKAPTYSKVRLVNFYLRNKNYIQDSPGFGYLIPKAYYKHNPGLKHQAILGVIFDSDVEKHRSQIFNPATKRFSAKLGETVEEYKRNLINGEDWKNKGTDKEIAQYKGEFHEVSSTQEYTKLTLMMGGHYWKNEVIPNEATALLNAKDVLKKQLNIDLNEISEDDLIIETAMTDEGIPQYNVGFEDTKQEILDKVDVLYQGKLTVSGMSFNGGVGVPDCVSNGYKLAAHM
ncbi:oxygen-dependent protoporphyrinogen oxidase [Saccharomycopsis crataegensis]|uniref:Protoporphyrinogen oxidase n=1 Tax=Saccharomycopsis crataegensis TaxID=43959 RepID=A0AAV5QUB4_9ASCO|nr:oxygen-dependent protoporphyrinogen oxidase [Saccharomycopsis crataegensis]